MATKRLGTVTGATLERRSRTLEELLENLRAAEKDPDRRMGQAIAETRHLAHELQVHQQELEVQNQQLEEAQALLEESRARYVELYDYAPVGYVTLDAAGVVQRLNLTAASLFQTERSRLEGRKFRVLVTKGSRRSFDLHLGRCFSTERGATVELGIPRGTDGGERPIELTSVPVRDVSGRMISLHVAILEVSDRRAADAERSELLAREQEARAAAERATRVKEDFLAMVSHELRTPLAPMVMWMKLLRAAEHDQDPALRARAMEVLEDCLNTQVRIIDDLMDVTRGAKGKLRIERQPLDLLPVLRAAVAGMEPAASAKRLDLRVSVGGVPGRAIGDGGTASGSFTILGDAARMQQIIRNLLSNAIKFTAEGGHINVGLDEAKGNVVLSVRDDGEGIPAGLLPHVFDAFRQKDHTSTRQHGGLGVGLAIVRNLVRLHGGSVDAASAGENQGALFTVTLPAHLEEAATVRGTSAAPATSDTRAFAKEEDGTDGTSIVGVRILIVEDDPNSREVLSRALALDGAQVVEADSAEAGRRVLAEGPVDLVLCDIAMPGEDGYSFVRKLRASEQQTGIQRTAAVALTAHASAEHRQRSLDAGFDLHIAKPIGLDRLHSELARTLACHRRGENTAPATDPVGPNP